MSQKIYKIVTRQQWDDALAQAVFRGAPVDLEDGYIHFSTREQVEETVTKHFKGQTGLLLVTFNTDQFGDALKWEPSRGGDLFPHLYAELEVDKATEVVELEDLPDGSHRFPKEF